MAGILGHYAAEMYLKGYLSRHLSEADLVKEFARELARRRAGGGKLDLDAIESFAGDVQRDLGEETLTAVIDALPAEDSTPKPCPKCGYPTPVKVRNRVRNILTVAGELRLSRNYHHCKCGTGFYPRDIELKLPEQGEVSDAMERRILDFGINETFEAVAERWSIHYPTTISSNLVRRVMDRVGLRCEAASSEEALQRASRTPPNSAQCTPAGEARIHPKPNEPFRLLEVIVHPRSRRSRRATRCSRALSRGWSRN